MSTTQWKKYILYFILCSKMKYYSCKSYVSFLFCPFLSGYSPWRFFTKKQHSNGLVYVNLLCTSVKTHCNVKMWIFWWAAGQHPPLSGVIEHGYYDINRPVTTTTYWLLSYTDGWNTKILKLHLYYYFVFPVKFWRKCNSCLEYVHRLKCRLCSLA